MTRTWREHPAAVEELRASALWYDDRRVGLGDDFMDAVGAAIASILDPAITWGRYLGRESSPQYYSRSVPGFPYDIVYLEIDGGIFILAYAQERMRPGYWSDRVKDI